MNSRRIIDVHQSLFRHDHMLGAERTLVMLSALVALVVGVGGMNLLSAVSAFTFWALSLVGLRKMAKLDPMLSQVWMRHIHQQVFYDAKSSKWRIVEGFKVKK